MQRRTRCCPAGLTGSFPFVILVLFLSPYPSRLCGVNTIYPHTGQPTENEELIEILQKSSNYCVRLQNIVLHFVCVEDVSETIYHPYRIISRRAGFQTNRSKREKNHYVYDYQLVRKEDFWESRSIIESNRDLRDTEKTRLNTKRFTYGKIVFGPNGVLSSESQKYYCFSILEKNRTLWERPVDVLKAVPRDETGSERLYGKVWIDRENGSVLKIEWKDTSMGNYSEIEDFAKKLDAEPKLICISEYKFEKNGIRFPSRFYINELYNRVKVYSFNRFPVQRDEKLEKSELDVSYKNYRFFIVEVQVKYGAD